MAVIMLLEEREAVQSSSSSSTDLCADTNFLFSIACCREKPVFTAQNQTNSITERDFVLVVQDTPLISLENKRFKNKRFFHFRMPIPKR